MEGVSLAIGIREGTGQMTRTFAVSRPTAFGLAHGLRAAAITGVLAVALTLAFVLVGGTGVADAAPKGPVAVFGQEGSGEGQFSSPAGVAVNQDSGDVYVVDVFNERVQRFDADGAFICV
jgi:DNA-binding beta-propeller fold protein YncE